MTRCKFVSRQTGKEVEGVIEAYWEVSFDPISDDYTPEEISATELLKLWAKQVQQKYLNELIPIFWYVEAKGARVQTFETLPLQYKHLPEMQQEDFLNFFTTPINLMTGKPLDWLDVPVIDKLWNSKRVNKGGFIQQATGWKPSILQPFGYLPALLSSVTDQT